MSRLASRIKWNSLFSFLSSFVRLLTNFLLFVGIARLHGTEAFGQFTIAHTYFTLFLLIADFGIDLLLTTKIAHEPSHSVKWVERFFPIKTIFSIVASLGLILISIFSDLSSMTRMLMVILSSGILANAIVTMCVAVFKGRENLFEEMRVSFIQNVLLLGALIILSITRAPLLYIAVAFVLSRAIGITFILPRVFTLLNLKRINFRFSDWRDTIKLSLPFGVHLLFGTLYFQLDTILLAYWNGEHAVGMYQSAMKLLVFILLVPDIISNISLPLLSRLHSENPEQWNRVGGIIVKTLQYAGLPLGLTLFIYADQVMTLAYGSGTFDDAIPILKLFAFTIIVRFSTDTYAVILTASKNQTIRMFIVIGMTAFNVVLNSLAIPRYGIEGAAVVSLITNVVASGLYVAAAHYKSFQAVFLIGPRQIAVVCSSILLWVLFPVLKIESIYMGVPVILLFYCLLYYFVGFSAEERTLVFAFPRKYS